MRWVGEKEGVFLLCPSLLCAGFADYAAEAMAALKEAKREQKVAEEAEAQTKKECGEEIALLLKKINALQSEVDARAAPVTALCHFRRACTSYTPVQSLLTASWHYVRWMLISRGLMNRSTTARPYSLCTVD